MSKKRLLRQAKSVGSDVLGQVVVALLDEAKTRAPDAIKKVREKTAEDKKWCRACGERVSKDIVYVVGGRGLCIRCGHRTHKHCFADTKRICQACLDDRITTSEQVEP